MAIVTRYRVECDRCGRSGPDADTDEAAQRAWFGSAIEPGGILSEHFCRVCIAGGQRDVVRAREGDGGRSEHASRERIRNELRAVFRRDLCMRDDKIECALDLFERGQGLG